MAVSGCEQFSLRPPLDEPISAVLERDPCDELIAMSPKGSLPSELDRHAPALAIGSGYPR